MLIPTHMVIQPDTGKACTYASQEEAWSAASRLAGPDRLWVVDNLTHDPVGRQAVGVAANPPGASPERALLLSRLPSMTADEVMRIPLKTAFNKIKPYLPKSDDFKSLTVVAGADPHKGLLRENAKLVKAMKAGKWRSTLTGLQLVPEYSVFKGHGAGNSEQKFTGWPRRLPKVPLAKSTLCHGSSALCRTACLQFSGQNVSPTAVNAKHRTTIALLERPYAFARVLVESCVRFKNNAIKKGLWPYIRLNVLSDIPWELVFPDMFEIVGGKTRTVNKVKRAHMFYDYTKLVGRETPENYNITFSFSGVNMSHCQREIDRGTNVAVPFLFVRRDPVSGEIVPLPRKSERDVKLFEGTPRQRYKIDLPKFWEGPVGMGRTIIDGDRHDIRPLDGQGEDGRGVWVGLRYKAAGGIQDKNLLKKVGAFVVNCLEDPETGLFIASETPGQTNVNTGA